MGDSEKEMEALAAWPRRRRGASYLPSLML